MILNKHLSTNGSQPNIDTVSYQGNYFTETILNGFFIVDRKWTVTFWNKAAEVLTGISSKEIINKNLWEKMVKTIPLEFYEVYHKAFQQKLPIHFEEYWGEMGAWFDVVAYVCEDSLCVSFKSSNITTFPKLPQQPEQTGNIYEIYKYIIEVTNDCLWEWNLESEELFWIDGGHKRVFGYPAVNTLVPVSFWKSLIHPDDKVQLLADLKRTLAKGIDCIWHYEYRFRKSDGTYAYVNDKAHVICNKGKARKMIGATQDVSEKKIAELALLESEKKLSLIARQTLNAVMITNVEGQIIWVNSAFARITEFSPDEVIGKKPGSFLQGADTDPLTVAYLSEKIKNKKPFDCDIVNYSKSGRKYWVHIDGQPLFEENGECKKFFAIQTDITEKKILQEKLASERSLRQKELTSAVLSAHENERAEIGKELHDNVNQLLGATKLYVEMAKTDTENKAVYLSKSSKYIMNVIEEIRKITKNLIPPGINDLGLFDSIGVLLDDLALLKLITITFHPVDINEEEINDTLQLNIFRIIQEQINNILKHSKATKVDIILNKFGTGLKLIISDNGKGADLAERKSGNGLKNIQSRAELCNGEVKINTQPGKGFQLIVTLEQSKS